MRAFWPSFLDSRDRADDNWTIIWWVMAQLDAMVLVFCTSCHVLRVSLTPLSVLPTLS